MRQRLLTWTRAPPPPKMQQQPKACRPPAAAAAAAAAPPLSRPPPLLLTGVSPVRIVLLTPPRALSLLGPMPPLLLHLLQRRVVSRGSVELDLQLPRTGPP